MSAQQTSVVEPDEASEAKGDVQQDENPDAPQKNEEDSESKSPESPSVEKKEKTDLLAEPEEVSEKLKEQQQKSMQGIVNSYAEKLALGEKKIEDVPEKFRDQVSEKFAELVEPSQKDEEIGKLKQRLDEKDAREDFEEAKKLSEAFEKGFKDGLPEEARKEFQQVYKERRKKGDLAKDSAKYAIGHLVEIGHSPDIEEAFREAQQVSGGKFYGAGAGAGSDEVLDSQEFKEYNAALVAKNITPLTKEEFKNYKKLEAQGAF